MGTDIYGNSKLIIYQCLVVGNRPIAVLPPTDIDCRLHASALPSAYLHVGGRAVAGRVLERGS